MTKRALVVIFVVLLAAAVPFVRPVAAAEAVAPVCGEADAYCPATSVTDLSHLLQNYPVPEIAAPNSRFAAVDFKVRKAITRTVNYQVATKGTVSVSLATFKSQVQAIFDDPRGWSRLGVKFAQVETGGAFTMYLAEASTVPGFGSPCDDFYNCNVGNNVVINDDRWVHGTEPWVGAGGNIIDYHHLSVNHETGHWLGHDHSFCSSVGQAAPVMQQQSIDLRGCKFNAWPLDSEIWSTRLGI
jgi:hypothetical protein